MIGRLGNRITYANVAATLALVLAMSGGAYAATKYVITSTKQIKPSVRAQLKGNSGARRAAGALGAPGAQGPAGGAGTAGKEGALGKDGKEGPPGPKGETGPKGEKGLTGFTETLPSKKTETGSWTDQVPPKAETDGREAIAFSSISFAIPLASALNGSHVFYVEPEAVAPEQCPGTVTEPAAAAGDLCLYGAFVTLVPAFGVIHDSSNSEFTAQGAAQTGAVLTFLAEGEGGGFAYGTWAVTAP
jgi:Collagen triple helix repeat (20 copies)